jgi:hypothetical protein
MRRALKGAVLCIFVGTAFAAGGALPVLAVQAVPHTAFSFYMYTTSTTTAYNLGCNQGTYDRVHGPETTEVFIDFGGQLSNGSGSLMVNAVSITNAQIEAVAEAFSHGYWSCTLSDFTSTLTLAIGTNNSYYDVSSSGGTTWAHVVSAVQTYNHGKGYDSQVIVAGANDIETFRGANSPSATIAWVNGWSNTTGAKMLNYGSADGCPQTTYNNGACTASGGWNQYDYWYVSWGNTDAFAAPEIYLTNGAQAAQWAMISHYGSTYKASRIYFDGPLDEYARDSSTNTPTAAWNQLWTAINKSSATSSNLIWSLEVKGEP